MKQLKLLSFISFIILSSGNHIISQDTELLINSAIAKNLANSLTKWDVDPDINYIQYQKNLRQALFPDSTQLSDNQKQIINKLNNSAFNAILNNYKNAKTLLKTDLKNQKQIQELKNELSSMINTISKVIDLDSMFTEFDSAGIFKDFENIEEINKFLDKKRKDAKQPQSDSVSNEIDPTRLAVSIIAAAVVGISAGVFIKLVSSKNTRVEFTKTSLGEIYKNLNVAIQSGEIKQINRALNDLVKEMSSLSKKEISLKDLILIMEQTPSMKLDTNLINQLRALNGLPVKTNSPLFDQIEKLTHAEENVEGILIDWETRYQKALLEKNSKAMSELIEEIVDTSNKLGGNKTEKSDILNLMEQHQDFSKAFPKDVLHFQILKQFNLTELRNIHNITDLTALDAQLKQLPKGKDNYINLKDPVDPNKNHYYKVSADMQFHEISYPPAGEKIVLIDARPHSLEPIHIGPHI